MEEVPFGKFGFIKKQSLDWLKTHLVLVAPAFLLFFVALLSAARFMKEDSQVDYLAAEIAYHHWKGEKGESFSKLKKILIAHPELHPKYDGVIAQKLLSSSENGLAASYAKTAFKRIQGFSPYYTDFSLCSLLISDKHYLKALERAKKLKVSLEKDSAFWEKNSTLFPHGYLLYAFNLLRIAILEGTVGTPEEEFAAWQNIKEMSGYLEKTPSSNRYDSEASLLIQKIFQSQTITLLDYIRHRESLLTDQLK